VSQREKWLGEQEWRLTKRKKKIKDRRTVRPLNGEKNLRNAGVSQSFCVRRVLASIHFREVDESVVAVILVALQREASSSSSLHEALLLIVQAGGGTFNDRSID